MKHRFVRWTAAIVFAVALLGLALHLVGRRSVPDASADSLRGSDVELVRVFPGITLQQPVKMTQPPGESARWYAVEQAGRLVTFSNDPKASKKAVALDITDRVLFGGEQGLLGIAFHPRFEENGWIYVNYVSEADGFRETRVSRFSRQPGRSSFDPKSEKIILRVGQPYSNHNGGEVLFGPDGYLYVGFGDGGLAGDPKGHGQNTRTLLGTVVRIDVDGGDPYAIPKDNPFADGKRGAQEIFAWGLRNPWRFSFDRKTGDLWAGDVGQNAWEEVDLVERGKNYGWAVWEGNHCYDPPAHLAVFGSGNCGESNTTQPPVFDYSQRLGDRSVTGGYVYRGSRNPQLAGKYIYGDFVSGRIWSYDPKSGENVILLDTPLSISAFVEAADGELGVLSYADGAIYHLTKRRQQ